VGSIDGS